MDTKIKAIVCGDVRGNFRQLFNRVESINKKSGPFEMLLCVGSFFGTNNDELIAYRNGHKLIPVPTYILGPCTKETQSSYVNEQNDGEICQNLTYLGKRGLYTFSSGVKIAYLSGVEENTTNTSGNGQETSYTFNKDDIIAVKNSCLVSKSGPSGYKGVDVLLTSQWPEGITKDVENGSKLISYLARIVRPKYHFCGMNNKYFESAPYRVPATDNITQLELATRFLALGTVGNVDKQKYIYALNITPVDKTRVMDLIQKTTDEINCPYMELEFTDLQEKREMSQGGQYFYDLSSYGDERNYKGGKRKDQSFNMHQKRQRLTIDQDKCWFCLSSPNVEKHLVISVGENFYLALAKGPLTNTHSLILSVTHIECSALLSKEDWKELANFKKSLKNMAELKGQVICFFERNYKSSHLQINAVSIAAGLAWKIKHAFEDKAEEYNITLETLPKLNDPSDLPQQGPYFVAELPDETTLLTRQMKRFPIHFAREAFCSENLLNCDEKIDWRECTLSKEEETSLVKSFRESYKPYDFTL